MAKKQSSNAALLEGLQTWSIEQIKPYWRNPRKGDAAVEAVKHSIQTYGYRQPIVVDPEGVIIVGHTRYRALLALGYTEASVVVADLPPEKAKAYRIADNRASDLAEWDEEKLVLELRELPDLAELAPFFPETDLAELIGESLGLDEVSVDSPVLAEELEAMASTANQTQAVPRVEVAPVSERAIERAERQEAQRIAKGVAEDISDEVAVTCPHCHQEFSVSARDIYARYQRKLAGDPRP